MEGLKQLRASIDKEVREMEPKLNPKVPPWHIDFHAGYVAGLIRASEGIGNILPDLEKRIACLESDNKALMARLAESEERVRKLLELPDRFICHCNEATEEMMTVFCKDQSIDRDERALRLMGAYAVVDVLTIFMGFLDGEYQ